MKALTPEEVALATFLHDVGKFWWPASGGRRPEEINSWLDFLPHDRSGRPTHVHAAYSASFVSQFVCGEDDDSLAATVARHHKPSTREDWIVAVSDRLASGEREFVGPDVPLPDPGQARISSPFSGEHYFPILRRSLCADLGATEKFHPTQDHQHEAGAMVRAWQDFTEDVKTIGTPLTDLRIWLELLREHTTRLPAQSPTAKGRYKPSVSIFDHSRVSAALAHILANSPLSDDEIERLPNKKDTSIKPFSLLIGDLSGVQPFLYTGTTARAVRALKGRSFFLQFLTESFASLVREELGLTPFAELYSGGGRFVLICPGKAGLTDLRKKVEQILLEMMGGQIGFAMAREDFGPFDLTAESGGMGEVLKRAGQALSQEKRRRFRTSASLSYDTVFGPYKASEECSVCRSPIEEGQADDTCQLCNAFISLGTRLRRASYLVEYIPDTTDPFFLLGRSVRPVRDMTEKSASETPRKICNVCQLNGFDSAELSEAIKTFQSGGLVTVGSKLLCSVTPEDPVDKSILPFEELAQTSKGDKNHIAIAKADVDDLGTLFHKVKTLSELASLSRAVSDFFDGRVTAIMDEESLKNRTYLVYSGGDDMLLAGAWDAAIEAAQRVRDELLRYTSGSCSLSAGIEVVHPKFPLRRGADASGTAEHKAKTLRPQKDAVCLMGVALPWDDLERVKALVHMVEKEIAEGRPRQLVNRLREIYWAYEKGKQELMAQGVPASSLQKAVRWYRWRWLLVYTLRRDAGKRADVIQKGLLDEGMEKYLGLLARWSELATRR